MIPVLGCWLAALVLLVAFGAGCATNRYALLVADAQSPWAHPRQQVQGYVSSFLTIEDSSSWVDWIDQEGKQIARSDDVMRNSLR